MDEQHTAEPPQSALTVHRAAERYRSEPEPGIDTRHAFSFSGHYDPANTHFGALLACNEETLAVGAGFVRHLHRDTEIVTWVVEGALAHRDDRGHATVVRPGHVQLLSAGSGVQHREANVGGAREQVRFLQFWLQPDEFGTEPGYGLRQVVDGTTVLAGAGQLRRGDAVLHLVRAGAYEQLPAFPAAPYRYLHVVRGGFGFRTRPGPHGVGRELEPGDSLRMTGDAEPHQPTAGPGGVEALLWEMHSPLRHG
ncbi:pirin family protein [Streptacidiphilus sp. PB12-B1b]|uniref:pirin family protein n=1 Tax=Streptacidiphilus sp. PB12-B1b TaxID=2705012 RepID=UPI0015FC917D|nr:pirin family protein [Streptacidiphilus sp. PB12-B1b]QMU75629.1 pirin family protein [Streptacidiphilus sp. PB12-B1b]